MALKFLHKKNFHTANLKNIEKVWLAEQKKAQEDKRLDQLRREIEEERQIQELKELQAKATGKQQSQRLDWMYEGHLAKSFNQDAKTAEDYLMGKPVELEKNDTQKLQAGDGPGALFLQKGASGAMDAQTKLKEDPMFEIRMQEKKALDLIKNNPVRMSVLREEALKMKEDKLRKKLEKKQRKKDEKERRKRGRSESSSDSDDGRRRRPEASSSGGAARERERDRDADRSRERERARGRSRSRSRSRSRERERDRDRSREGRDGEGERGREEAHRHGGRRDERGQLIGEADRQYGLVVKPRGGLSFPTARKEPEKLEVLPEKRVDPHAEKKRLAWEARERARKLAEQTSAEEREKRLREMRADAEQYESARFQRKREDMEKAEAEEKAVAKAQQTKDVHSTFLGAVQRSVYEDGAATTEERIRSTAHFRQRAGDFLRK